MSEQRHPDGEPPDRAQSADPDADPTADFLNHVRPEETPWRRDRPADPAEQEGGGDEPAGERRSHTFAKAARRAAPYIQGAAVAGWVASAALDDQYEDGFEQGYDSGFDAGAGGTG